MYLSYIFIGISVLISYKCLNDRSWLDRLVHYPYIEKRKKEYYRWITGGLIHGSMNHLLINMFVFYQFGPFVEQYLTYRFGQVSALVLFGIFVMLGLIVSNIGTYMKHQDNSAFRSLGASGVTSAIVLIYCLYDPWQMFIFPPVPAIIFAILYIGYSQWASMKERGHIDHQGHLWGALYGVIFISVVDPYILQIFWEKVTTLPF